MRVILSCPRVAVFLVMAVLFGIGMGTIDGFMFLYLKQLGACDKNCQILLHQSACMVSGCLAAEMDLSSSPTHSCAASASWRCDRLTTGSSLLTSQQAAAALHIAGHRTPAACRARAYW